MAVLAPTTQESADADAALLMEAAATKTSPLTLHAAYVRLDPCELIGSRDLQSPSKRQRSEASAPAPQPLEEESEDDFSEQLRAAAMAQLTTKQRAQEADPPNKVEEAATLTLATSVVAVGTARGGLGRDNIRPT